LTPTREDVLGRVRHIVAELEDLDPEGVRPESDLERDLGMDSLSRVELQMAIEDEFGAELSETAASSIRTVGEAVDAVTEALWRL
jgi:acyl carrier protein